MSQSQDSDEEEIPGTLNLFPDFGEREEPPETPELFSYLSQEDEGTQESSCASMYITQAPVIRKIFEEDKYLFSPPSPTFQQAMPDAFQKPLVGHSPSNTPDIFETLDSSQS